MNLVLDAYYSAYQQRLWQLRQSAYLNYPQLVHLESQALCPAACSFCAYPVLRRKGTRMDDALVDKIMTDLEDIPKSIPFNLIPFKVSEPFMEPRLMSMLKRANERLPNAQLSLHTSAAPLTEAKLLALNELQNFHHLAISVHDPRPEVYTRLMQLPWERTWERLQMVHRHKAAGRLNFPVHLARVGDGTP
ncbi:MAG: radical SAM protein, partial [Candidatus Sericytochromatia bacterium]